MGLSQHLRFQDVITKALKLSFGEDVRVLEHNDDDAMPASDELLRVSRQCLGDHMATSPIAFQS